MKIHEMRTQSKIEGSDEGSGDRENAVKGHNFENSKEIHFKRYRSEILCTYTSDLLASHKFRFLSSDQN